MFVMVELVLPVSRLPFVRQVQQGTLFIFGNALVQYNKGTDDIPRGNNRFHAPFLVKSPFVSVGPCGFQGDDARWVCVFHRRLINPTLQIIAQFVLNFRFLGGNLEKVLAIRGTAWYSIQATKGGPLPLTRHF